MIEDFTIYAFCERLVSSSKKEWLVAAVVVTVSGRRLWDRKKDFPIDASRAEIGEFLAHWQSEAMKLVMHEIGDAK